MLPCGSPASQNLNELRGHTKKYICVSTHYVNVFDVVVFVVGGSKNNGEEDG